MAASFLLEVLKGLDAMREKVNAAWLEADRKEKAEFVEGRPKKYGRPVFEDAHLRYAATMRCECGAGMAYVKNSPASIHGQWECSSILKGEALPKSEPGSVSHTPPLPFAFYEVKSEDQPSANGATTRPQ